jgi:hypothetical protein
MKADGRLIADSNIMEVLQDVDVFNYRDAALVARRADNGMRKLFNRRSEVGHIKSDGAAGSDNNTAVRLVLVTTVAATRRGGRLP